MSMILREPLASQVQQLADAAGVSVEALVAAALEQYQAHARRLKLSQESEWWQSLPPNIRVRYAGQFVAVHNQVIVDYDRDEEALRGRIQSRYASTPVYITRADRRSELRLVSRERIR